MMATTANIIRGYHDLESEICEGCDGRGRCPDRPCVEEAEKDLEFGDPSDDAEDLATDRIWSREYA